jgi:hypothetical protein
MPSRTQVLGHDALMTPGRRCFVAGLAGPDLFTGIYRDLTQACQRLDGAGVQFSGRSSGVRFFISRRHYLW